MPAFLVRSLTLFALIVLGSRLGLAMSPPANVALFWPPAGVAFAALLLWGRSMCVAIFLGLTLANLLLLNAVNIDANDKLTIAALLLALGGLLQSLLAMRLSHRNLGMEVPRLDNARQIVWFFFLTGPLSSLLGSSFELGVLLQFNLLNDANALSAWLDCWIGNTLGILLISPLIFCLWAHPKHLWTARRLRVALPVVISLLALATVFAQVSNSERERLQAAFDHQAIAIDHLLNEHANNAVDNTLAVRDLFVAHQSVTRQEFASFSQSLLDRHREVLVLEWLPRVAQGELAEFEKRIRREGQPQFNVTERKEAGQLVHVGPRADYFPITYAEPINGNEIIIGLDSAANAISRASKQEAARTGKPSASQRIPLIQINDQAAVLLSVPIFPPAIRGPVANVAGFVSAVILPSRMVEIAMQGISAQAYSVELLDLSAPSDSAVLYTTPNSTPIPQNLALNAWQRRFAFCDRVWQLTIQPNQGFLELHGSNLPWIILLSGASFTALLSLLLLILSGQTAQVEALINARTTELERANRELKAKERVLRKSENHLRTLVESQPECVQLLSREGMIQDINPAGLKMLGADNLQQVKGLPFVQRVQASYQPGFRHMITKVFEGDSWFMDFEITTLQGERRWLETHSVPMRNHFGQITAVLAICRDISERKQADAKLQMAARVFGEAHEGILITDPQGVIVDVNPTFCEITGYSREEAVGRSPSFLNSGRQSIEFYHNFWLMLIQERHWQGELWNKRKNGELYAEWLTVSALCDEHGHVLYYVGLFSDITQLKKQQQMLELLAHYDPLTQVPNRALFSDRLFQAIARAKRDRALLAICFLDLDGFKPINDQFGHDAGDMVLIEIARRIKACIREEDTVSRHGGDEFALLLGNLRSVDECEQALHRINQAIVQPLQIDGHQINVGASVGITLYPLDDADSDTLLRHADHAMYQAKLAGKNCHSFFNANEDRQVIDRHKHVREIEAAFENNELCLHYQPKINLQTNQVYGVEVLIRWQHPELGIVLPKGFLPVIAGNDLEIRIGNWVIEQAWQQLVAWNQSGLKLEVSVNISAYHLLNKGFVDHLVSTLAQNPEIESHYLQLEILESTALDDLEAVNRIITLCRDTLGISFALDDFGTGYSSLTHLRHLPIDTVKIDRDFVRDMLDDPDDYAIVESIIGLSKVFRRHIVAEGVESPEQGLVLMLMGCQLVQGMTIASAMPAEQIPIWLASYQPPEIWRYYNTNDLTPTQSHIAIRRIDLNHWLKSIENCVLGEMPHIENWPQMSAARSLFGRWLEHAQHHQQYNGDWLSSVSDLHQQLRLKAQLIMRQCRNGNLDQARNSLLELKTIQRSLDDRLAEHA